MVSLHTNHKIQQIIKLVFSVLVCTFLSSRWPCSSLSNSLTGVNFRKRLKNAGAALLFLDLMILFQSWLSFRPLISS